MATGFGTYGNVHWAHTAPRVADAFGESGVVLHLSGDDVNFLGFCVWSV